MGTANLFDGSVKQYAAICEKFLYLTEIHTQYKLTCDVDTFLGKYRIKRNDKCSPDIVRDVTSSLEKFNIEQTNILRYYPLAEKKLRFRMDFSEFPFTKRLCTAELLEEIEKERHYNDVYYNLNSSGFPKNQDLKMGILMDVLIQILARENMYRAYIFIPNSIQLSQYSVEKLLCKYPDVPSKYEGNTLIIPQKAIAKSVKLFKDTFRQEKLLLCIK